jgi:hypothetical protein
LRNQYAPISPGRVVFLFPFSYYSYSYLIFVRLVLVRWSLPSLLLLQRLLLVVVMVEEEVDLATLLVLLRLLSFAFRE